MIGTTGKFARLMGHDKQSTKPCAPTSCREREAIGMVGNDVKHSFSGRFLPLGLRLFLLLYWVVVDLPDMGV